MSFPIHQTTEFSNYHVIPLRAKGLLTNVANRVTSMMFGRPPMISMSLSRQITLPTAIDDDLLTSAPEAPASQPAGLPSSSAFFVEAVKMLQIVGDVLDMFYGESSGVNMTGSDPEKFPRPIQDMINGNYQQVLRLDNALTVWKEGLPSMLRWNDGDASDLPNLPQHSNGNAALFLRQASVLQARSVSWPYGQGVSC